MFCLFDLHGREKEKKSVLLLIKFTSFFIYVILQQVDRPEDGGIPMHGLVTDHYQISGVPLVPIQLPLKLLRRGHLIGKLRDAPSVYSVHTRRKWCSMCLAHSLGIAYLHQGSYTVTAV